MKALEILLAIRGFSWNEDEVDEAIAELEKLNEDYSKVAYDFETAVNKIAELEEMTKPKYCDGCKYEGQGRYRAPCEYCSRTLWDEYEPKETK